jgi:hypothetical protein
MIADLSKAEQTIVFARGEEEILARGKRDS